MNSKFNLWTLLFLLAIAGWFFTYLDLTKTEVSNLDHTPLFFMNSDDGYSDIISKEKFDQRRNFYLNEVHNELQNGYKFAMESHQPAFEELPSYFKLEPDMLNQLNTLNPDNVWVCLVAEGFNVTGGRSETCAKGISLVFSTEPPDDNVPEARYFNFATPCPPMCDTTKKDKSYFCEPIFD